MKTEVIVCYDIENNKVRKKIYDGLMDFGLRSIQKSVFWGSLIPAEINAVKVLLEDMLDEGVDRAFVCPCSLEEQKSSNFKFGYMPGEIEDWPEYGCL